jgi:hypothetical protein
VLPFDDEELAGVTVADVLADPARFEGATLADPLEGVSYGQCAKRGSCAGRTARPGSTALPMGERYMSCDWI